MEMSHYLRDNRLLLPYEELMRLFHCGASSKDAGKRITTGCHLQVAAVDVLGRIKIALLPCIVRDVIELEVVDKTLMTWVSRYVR